jgi:hypothetical protein
MQRVLTSADKIIIGSNIAVPFISLVPPQKQKWVVQWCFSPASASVMLWHRRHGFPGVAG